MRINALAFFAVLACCSSVSANGFASLGEHSRLTNHAIVEAGDVERLEPPSGTKWKNEVLRINNRCVEVRDFLGFWGFGKRAGFLLVDQARSTKIALLQIDLSSIKVEIKSVLVIDCPSSAGDPAILLEEMRQQREELQRKLEKLKRQNRAQ